MLSVAAHAVRARRPGGAGPTARAAVRRVVRHRGAPPAAAQPPEWAPPPARAAVARAGEHVGARAAAALDEAGAGAGARSRRVPGAARCPAAHPLPPSCRGENEPAREHPAVVVGRATARRCVYGNDHAPGRRH